MNQREQGAILGSYFKGNPVDEIAKFIIKESESLGNPVSNLKLQYLLYFCYIEYLNKYKEPLFQEIIQEWKCGPVVPSIYWRYCTYGALAIHSYNLDYVNLPIDVVEVARAIIHKYLDFSVYDLLNHLISSSSHWATIIKQPFEVPATIERESAKESKPDSVVYFEVENTTDEYHSSVSGRYTTFEAAQKNMYKYSDWYCPNGTGFIYKVTLTFDSSGVVHKDRVYLGRYVMPDEWQSSSEELLKRLS